MSTHDALLAPFATPLDEQLADWAARYGDSTALVDRHHCLSYRALNERADIAARHLHTLGIVPGDHVLLQLPNSADFVIVLFALLRLGALPILIVPSLRERDLLPLLEATQPTAYVMETAQHRAQAETFRTHCPALRLVIGQGDSTGMPFDPANDSASDDPTVHALSSLNAPCAQPLPSLQRSGFDTAVLLLSGGTTGVPKLIPRTHADYSYNFRTSAKVCGMDERSVYLAILPIAHNFPLACPGLLGALSQGGRVVLSDTASSDEAMPLIASQRVTHLALVPALARLWQQAREWEDSDLSSLTVMQVGGAPLDPHSAEALSRTFSCALQQVFGMAEGLLCYTRLDDDDDTCYATQGRPLSCHDEIRIVDEQERPVPTGHIGQLLTRGPYTITGYYRAPAASAQSFTADGFYRTGDLASCDARGYVRVKGRLKEQINRAGEKIAAASVETGLKQLPGIEDAVVVAVPDVLLGERICAVLMTSAPLPPLPELRHALAGYGLSGHSLPDQLIAVAHWPLTAVGKIDRQALIRQALIR